jgi:hypothetical protein
VAKLLIGAPDLGGGLGSFGLVGLVGLVGHHGVAPGEPVVIDAAAGLAAARCLALADPAVSGNYYRNYG